MKKLILGLLLLANDATVLNAQEADVTFFVVGKHAGFRQDESGTRTLVDYSFFSEIFLRGNGDASDATLTDPEGSRTVYADQRDAEVGERDNLLLVSGKRRYADLAALQADYPDGDYRVAFTTPSGTVRDAQLVFSNASLPAAPRILLEQDGQPTCTVVNPSRGLQVRWSPFSEGGPDPAGILDDLVFVILTDGSGARIAHSGRPFEDKPFLTYAADEFLIPAATMHNGSRYTLSVEHAILDDTRVYNGIPAMTTRAVTTTLGIVADESQRDSPGACMAANKIPSITSQTVMFYYRDLAAPASFYGTALGLERTLDWEWAKMFRTGPDSTVGLILEGEGAFHKVQAENAVMLSLVTDEVDAWYRRLKARKDVKFLKEIKSGSGIRSFLLEDPGGYTVEFFQWLNEDGQ